MKKSPHGQMKRNIDEVMDCCLSPPMGIGGASLGTERRVEAVLRVLQRIPEKAYRALCEKADDFVWFIPVANWEGMVTPFPCTVPATNDLVAMANVLYLSPNLEFCDLPFVIAVVAHELAHIGLNHKLRADAATYEKQENEAWSTITAWGFEKEKRAYMKVRKQEADEDEKEKQKVLKALRKLKAKA